MGHLRASGFEVREENVGDLAPVKRRLQVPAALQSCHTAVIGDYVVEGHVPADLIKRLLRERPAVLGLAVPGMRSAPRAWRRRGGRPSATTC